MTDATPTEAGKAGPVEDDLQFEDVPEPGGPALGLVAAAVPVVLGGLGAVLSWRLGVGELADPGPGLWPLIVSVAMVAIGLALLVTAVHDTSTESFTRGMTGTLVAALSLLGYTAVIEHIGFEIPTVLLAVVWLKVIGSETWRSTLLVGVLSAAALHLIFVELLGVNLPRLI